MRLNISTGTLDAGQLGRAPACVAADPATVMAVEPLWPGAEIAAAIPPCVVSTIDCCIATAVASFGPSDDPGESFETMKLGRRAVDAGSLDVDMAAAFDAGFDAESGPELEAMVDIMEVVVLRRFMARVSGPSLVIVEAALWICLSGN